MSLGLPRLFFADHAGSGTGLVSIALRQYLAQVHMKIDVEITATDLGELLHVPETYPVLINRFCYGIDAGEHRLKRDPFDCRGRR